MDHQSFKAKQTAAVYVAHGLDDRTLEAFEMHMMGCNECVADVETWRAIKLHIPARPRGRNITPESRPVSSGWRMAATLVTGVVAGSYISWTAHVHSFPNPDSTQTGVYNLPSLSRGWGDCARLRVATDTEVAYIRVPDIPAALHVVPLNADKQELNAQAYSWRAQPDGSGVLKLATQWVVGRTVYLERRVSGGDGESVGCITGEVVQPGR